MMGLQFMTGTPEIMTKYISILCLLLIINSCSRQLKGVDSNKAVKNIQLITSAYDVSEDSLLVKALVLFPISNLVFIKQDSTFEASVEIIFRIENKDSELQTGRVSYNKKIIKEYYNETRYEELYSFCKIVSNASTALPGVPLNSSHTFLIISLLVSTSSILIS